MNRETRKGPASSRSRGPFFARTVHKGPGGNFIFEEPSSGAAVARAVLAGATLVVKVSRIIHMLRLASGFLPAVLPKPSMP